MSVEFHPSTRPTRSGDRIIVEGYNVIAKSNFLTALQAAYKSHALLEQADRVLDWLAANCHFEQFV
jgi:predicted RNA-binding protein with PIN domain